MNDATRVCRDCRVEFPLTREFYYVRRVKKNGEPYFEFRHKLCYNRFTWQSRGKAYRKRKDVKPRVLVRYSTQQFVRHGVLIKPSCCELCFEPVPRAKLEAHHLEYRQEDRRDPMWLCRGCHMKVEGRSLTPFRRLFDALPL